MAEEQSLKVFIGGLSQETTKESLDAYFGQFGSASSIVMMDGSSGRSRGFGFVDFADEGTVAGVLAQQHEIDGVAVSCKSHSGKKGGGSGKGGGKPMGGKGGNMAAEGSQMKIFVGGLSQSTTKEMLDTYFNVFGQVDSYIMMDKSTGRSRGFGFVNFRDPNVMSEVLETVHEIDGVSVTCSNYSGGSGGGGYSPIQLPGAGGWGGGRSAAPFTPSDGSSLKIFVGGIPQTATKQDLTDYFSQWGRANGIIMMDKSSGRSRGFGFVDFEDPSAMNAVLDYPSHELHGAQISCSVHGDSKGGGGKGGGGGKAAKGGGSAGGGKSTEELLGTTLSLLTQLAQGLQGTGGAGAATANQIAQLAASVQQAVPGKGGKKGGKARGAPY